LVNRIVYCFLEFTRNVPVLLHILFIHGLVVILLPVPKKALNFSDSFFLTNRGFFIPQPVWEPGAEFVMIAFIFALACVFWFSRWAKKNQNETGEVYPVFFISISTVFVVTGITFLFSGLPLSWDIPELKGFNFKGGFQLNQNLLLYG
jgi:general L-amino acid transport system permease protein